jgi:CheY-like chemotaxis protein
VTLGDGVFRKFPYERWFIESYPKQRHYLSPVTPFVPTGLTQWGFLKKFLLLVFLDCMLSPAHLCIFSAAFTHALTQKNATAGAFLNLASLVLQSECVAKSAKKILLVEDNDDVRELLAQFMKRLGYTVFEAATGLKAIDLTSTVRPDLIMMDLRLPEMNGADAMARLKADPSNRGIPLLVITAYGAGIDTRRALDAGAAEILHKPVDVTTLRNVLRQYLPVTTTKRRSSRKK